MSNLNLPSLKYSDLRAKLDNASKSRVKLAYETEVQDSALSIDVLHHGHTIAEVTKDHIELDNHGWYSQTTAARMSRVLADNGFSERVAIRQGEMALLDASNKIIQRGIRTITAKRVDGHTFVQAYNG